MADPRKPVLGALKAIQLADKMADEQLAAGKLKAALEAQQAPMTRPQGTGLPLMPRDNGMYTLRDQKDLPRMPMVDKARAENKSPKYNERMQDLLDSPKARKKVDNLINKGKELKIQEWYGTEPLRQVAMDAGRTPEQFESMLAQLASASQRNPVDKQNQMGSYLYHLSETGQLPENSLLLTNKLKRALAEDPSLAQGRQLVELPKGYGSLAQGDIFNRAVMIGQGNIGEALPPNKKLGTFYENLLGNLKPVTVDVNALRGPIIEQGDPRWLTSKLVEKDDKGKVINSYKPREMFDTGEMSMREAQQRPGFWEAAPKGSEYAGFEELWQRGAKRHGVEPAEAQALGWYGSGVPKEGDNITALKTKPENYVDNLERLIKRTAEQTGKSPSEVMNDMVTGKGFLRKDGGAVERKETAEEMDKFHKCFKMHKAFGGAVVKKVDGGKIAKGVMGAFDKASKAADAAMAGSKALPAMEKGGWPIDVPGRSGITATSKQEVKGLADSFADSVREMGFDATVDHSGSKAGASSYVRINDPQTGRFINKPIRISDHSKGTRELQGVIEILNPASDFEKVFSMLQDMRSQGPAASMVQIMHIDQLAEKLIAEGVKPKTAYRSAREAEVGRVNRRIATTGLERDANLAKFLEDSKTQMRLYHGTTATEGGKGKEAIRQLKSSKEGALGSGVYLTPQASHASGYSGIPNDEALALMRNSDYGNIDHGKKMADQFMADRAAGTVREGQEGGNMLPVYAQLKNPLVIKAHPDPERYRDPMIEALTQLGMDEKKAVNMVERAYDQQGYIGKQVQNRAQAQGYDGLMQYDRNGDLSEVVSYNPSAIKSAIGNEGTYDTSIPHMGKADGGKIAKGLMGALTKASKMADDAMAASKVLPVAERDANLAKYLDKSKVKNRAYHATDQDVKSFDPKSDKRTENKSNIAGWMTNDPEFANDFAAQKFRHWKTSHRPWEEDPNVPPGANIMPVHLSIENPFYATDLIKNLSGELNMDEANAVAKALGVRVDDLIGDIPKVIKYKASNYEREHTPRGFDLVKSDVATDAMRRLGYDGVIATENGSEVYAPFNSTQIKSATGNRGTYDITKPDINEAKGGAIRKESPEEMKRFSDRFAFHKANGKRSASPQKFDDGGIASPSDEVNQGAAFGIYQKPKGGEDLRKGGEHSGFMAELLAKMAKDQGKQEVSSLDKPRAATDLLNRGVLANNPLSAVIDMVNMGLVPLDVLGSKLTGRDIKVSSDKPFLGSEYVKDLMNQYGVTSGEERPMMETALSFASPTAMIKGAMKATDAAKKAPELIKKATDAFTSSKLPPLATEAKTASAGKPTGATYATKQDGPFFRVSPTALDTSKAKSRGIREGDELQGSTPLGGSAESTGRETPQFLSSEEVGRIIADPVANEPLNIAKKYTQETQGVDFGVPNIPESTLAKQSAIGRTQQLAVDASPEYKTAVFDAYAKQMPDVLEQAGAKNYDDLMEKAYRQMAKETDDQFRVLPYNFSYHRAGEGNYNGAMDMASDVHGNKHLYVYQGGDKHDFLNRIDPASGLNENEKFRAVHDLLGHAIYGNQFGPKGEEMAWAVHSQMYSPLARLAMTSETRGQNSMVNYSPLNAELKAQLAKYDDMAVEARRKGDKALLNKIIAAKRQAYSGFEFAPNKAVLLPPEFLSTQYAGGMPAYLEAANRPVKGTETQSVLTHFSNDPNLRATDPSRYGTGIKGAEGERLRDYPGAVRDRSYFYMGEPGTVAPEPGLGVNRYRGEASSLYDITQDPLNFQKLARESNRTPFTAKYNQGITHPLQDANDIERLVKEYGYQGMANPKASKPMAIMFKETPVRRQARGGLTLMK